MQDYDLRIEISYRYDMPARASRSILRLVPHQGPDQMLLSSNLTADPPPTHQDFAQDFFGNAMTGMVHEAALDAITFRFAGRVRRWDQSSGLDLSCSRDMLDADIAGLPSIAPDAPHHFTAPSRRAMPDPSITAFARDAMAGDRSTLAAARSLARAIFETMRFDPTTTEVTTDPSTAFGARSGVCQDFSHIMIAGLRALGIPAGYVSGFLRTTPPPGQPRLEGADAMHAWVRVWCGARAGWVEIDPTNNIDAGADHIPVAYGRDYADVSPVKGAVRSAGAHTTDHKVDVIAI